MHAIKSAHTLNQEISRIRIQLAGSQNNNNNNNNNNRRSSPTLSSPAITPRSFFQNRREQQQQQPTDEEYNENDIINDDRIFDSDDDNNNKQWRSMPENYQNNNNNNIGSYHDGYVHGREDFGDFLLRKRKHEQEQKERSTLSSTPKRKMIVHRVDAEKKKNNTPSKNINRHILSPASSSSSDSDAVDFFKPAVISTTTSFKSTPVETSTKSIIRNNRSVSTNTENENSTGQENANNDSLSSIVKTLQTEKSEYQKEVERLKRELSLSPSQSPVRKIQDDNDEHHRQAILLRDQKKIIDEERTKNRQQTEEISQLKILLDSLRKTESSAGERILHLEESLKSLSEELTTAATHHSQTRIRNGDDDDNKDIIEEQREKIKSLQEEISYIHKIQKEKEEDLLKSATETENSTNSSSPTATKPKTDDCAVGRAVNDDDEDFWGNLTEASVERKRKTQEQQDETEAQKLSLLQKENDHHRRETEMLNERILYLEEVLRSKQLQEATSSLDEVLLETFQKQSQIVKDQFDSVRRDFLKEQEKSQVLSEEEKEQSIRRERQKQTQEEQQREEAEKAKEEIQKLTSEVDNLKKLLEERSENFATMEIQMAEQQNEFNSLKTLEEEAAERISYLEGLLNDVQSENEWMNKELQTERETTEKKIAEKTLPLEESIKELNSQIENMIRDHKHLMQQRAEHAQQIFDFCATDFEKSRRDIVDEENSDFLFLIANEMIQSQAEISKNERSDLKREHEQLLQQSINRSNQRLLRQKSETRLTRSLFLDESTAHREAVERSSIHQQEAEEFSDELLRNFTSLSMGIFLSEIMQLQQQNELLTKENEDYRQGQLLNEEKEAEAEEERQQFANIIKRQQELLEQLQVDHDHKETKLIEDSDTRMKNFETHTQMIHELLDEEDAARNEIAINQYSSKFVDTWTRTLSSTAIDAKLEKELLFSFYNDERDEDTTIIIQQNVITETRQKLLELREDQQQQILQDDHDDNDNDETAVTSNLIISDYILQQHQLLEKMKVQNQLDALSSKLRQQQQEHNSISEKQTSRIQELSTESKNLKEVFTVECLIRVEAENRNIITRNSTHEMTLLLLSCQSKLAVQVRVEKLEVESRGKKLLREREADELEKERTMDLLRNFGGEQQLVDRSELNVGIRNNILHDSIFHGESVVRSSLEIDEQSSRFELIDGANVVLKINQEFATENENDNNDFVISNHQNPSNNTSSSMILLAENEELEARMKIIQDAHQQYVLNIILQHFIKEHVDLVTEREAVSHKEQLAKALLEREKILREQFSSEQKFAQERTDEILREQERIHAEKEHTWLSEFQEKELNVQEELLFSNQNFVQEAFFCQEAASRRSKIEEVFFCFSAKDDNDDDEDIATNLSLKIKNLFSDALKIANGESKKQLQTLQAKFNNIQQQNADNYKKSTLILDQESQSRKEIEFETLQELHSMKLNFDQSSSQLLLQISKVEYRDVETETKTEVKLHHHQTQTTSKSLSDQSAQTAIVVEDTLKQTEQQKQKQLQNLQLLMEQQEQKLSSEIEFLKAEMSKKEKYSDQLRQQLENNIDEKNSQIDILTKEIESLKQKQNESESMINRMMKERESLLVKDDDKKDSDVSDDQQQVVVKQLQISLKKAEEELSSVQSHHQRVLHQLQQEQNENEKNQNNLQQTQIEGELQLRLRSKEFELKNLQQDFQLVSSRLDESRDQISLLEEQIRSNRETVNEEVQQQTNTLQGKGSEFLEMMKKLKEKRVEDEQRIDELTKLNQELGREIERLMKLIFELEQRRNKDINKTSDDETVNTKETIDDETDHQDDEDELPTTEVTTDDEEGTTEEDNNQFVRLPRRPIVSQPAVELSNDQKDWYEGMRDSKN